MLLRPSSRGSLSFVRHTDIVTQGGHVDRTICTRLQATGLRLCMLMLLHEACDTCLKNCVEDLLNRFEPEGDVEESERATWQEPSPK